MTCICGDLYCPSCGPAQGSMFCSHGMIQGDCDKKSCYNNVKTPKKIAEATMAKEAEEIHKMEEQMAEEWAEE